MQPVSMYPEKKSLVFGSSVAVLVDIGCDTCTLGVEIDDGHVRTKPASLSLSQLVLKVISISKRLAHGTC